MRSYNILSLPLLMFGSLLVAADHQQGLEAAKEVHVKVRIYNSVYNYPEAYDRYVSPTLSLGDLMEQERVRCMEIEHTHLEELKEKRQMTVNAFLSFEDGKFNVHDSIQKYQNTELYLRYEKK